MMLRAVFLCSLLANVPNHASVSVTKWQLVQQDVSPGIVPLSNAKMPDRTHCLIFCQENPNCKSVAFKKPNECVLYANQLKTDDANLAAEPSSIYYNACRVGNCNVQQKEVRKPKGYRIFNEENSFKNAQDECQKIGGSLACIPDEATQKNVEEFLKTSKTSHMWLWIGIEAPAYEHNLGNQNHTKSEFTRCVDGTDLQEFSWWRPLKQPNNPLTQHVGVQIVAKLDSDQFGRWYDDDALKEYPFLCEYEDEIEINVEIVDLSEV